MLKVSPILVIRNRPIENGITDNVMSKKSIAKNNITVYTVCLVCIETNALNEVDKVPC